MGDLRYALRALRRSPGFTVTALMTLAVGIAANTFIAAIVSGFAFRTIPAPPGTHLIRLYPLAADGGRENLFTGPEYAALRGADLGLRNLVAYVPAVVTARTPDRTPRETLAYFVSGQYFTMLGGTAAAGRLLAPRDDGAGAPPVAVISPAWMKRLGGGRDVLGRTIDLNGRAFTIVGVAAESFVGTEPVVADVWVPLSAAGWMPGVRTGADPSPPVLLIASMDPAMPAAAVEAHASAVLRNATDTLAREHRRSGVTAARATFFPVDRDPLAVGVLVLLATWLLLTATAANVSNLVLARGIARRRETAIRLAMGAPRFRIARQLLLEVLGVSAAAVLLGLLLSSWALSAVYAAALPHLPFQWGTVLLDLSPDWRVFAYTCAVCVLVTLGVALAPIADANRVSLTSALHGGPAVVGRRWARWQARTLLVSTQVAVSLALAIVAGLLARAATRADAVELGFEPKGVLTATYDLARQGQTPAQAARINREARARAQRLGGVTVATLASHVPLTGGLRTTSAWSPESGAEAARPYTRYVYVGSGYFRALGIPVVAGRDVSPAATARPVREAVVSEIVARQLWPSADPLGMRLRTSLTQTEYTVVGIARDTRASSLWRGKEAAVYLSADTDEEVAGTRLVVSCGSPEHTTPAVRRMLLELEPGLVADVTTLESAVALWTLPSRVARAVSGGLALVGLLIASVGLYAVLRHVLAQQARELAIRRALGADAPQLVRYGLQQAARLVLPGLATGLAIAFVLARMIAAFLFDISPADVPTYAAATTLTCGAGLLACLLPARRAARAEPMAVLRSE